MLHTHVDVDYGCDWIDMPPVLSRTSLDWPRRESTCWLCGGWVERKILWPVRGADVPQNAVMKTHLEIDNWEGEAMKMTPEGLWELDRVLPPGRHRFYFSVVDEPSLCPMLPTEPFKTESKSNVVPPHKVTSTHWFIIRA